ncbi:hypothetical protein SAMN05216174_101890 [Actinokineospora iranica]|uniref:Uncharacterized protein n=1 Tax=Actinokineospora iranica TaxID=1271860 RepID=A0A1G6KFT2_9PSEU|nr:hypothetical protein SAMN05216174_101890 [Actinokineospora iranica]
MRLSDIARWGVRAARGMSCQGSVGMGGRGETARTREVLRRTRVTGTPSAVEAERRAAARPDTGAIPAVRTEAALCARLRGVA